MKFSTYVALALAVYTHACLLPEERNGEALDRSRFHLEARQSSNTPIGTGDRFSGGTVAPRGLGSQSTNFTTLLNVNEIVSGLKGLASKYSGSISTFNLPYKTHLNATVVGAQVGGTAGNCTSAYRVDLNGNIHARERGSADGILYFISDLLYANANNVGLTYGSKTYTNAQVKTALATGIVFIPLSNPDGVAYDQSTNSCWRKNRNPAGYVDLNRNFDFVWDLNKFAASVRGSVASTSPSSEVYHGTAPFSEPETKNIKWVMDTYSRVRWFVDLHSYAGDVLYSWGSDDNQSTTPGMNFMNSSYDSVRGILGDSSYREYTPTAENSANVAAAQAMRDGLTAGGGRAYTAFQASDLYPTSGASDDYSYSRHFANTSTNLIHGYTVEFGFGGTGSCPFYPSVTNFNANLRAVGAGFMELLLSATSLGLGDAVTC